MAKKTKIEVIETELKLYFHKKRMRLFNESYKNLHKNPQAWEEELGERNILEGTLRDGFEIEVD